MEGGEYEPTLESLPVFAELLTSKPWTLAWGAELQGDTDFVAAMRSIDERLDDRGRLTVELLAQQQARMAQGENDFGPGGVFPQDPQPPSSGSEGRRGRRRDTA